MKKDEFIGTLQGCLIAIILATGFILAKAAIVKYIDNKKAEDIKKQQELTDFYLNKNSANTNYENIKLNPFDEKSERININIEPLESFSGLSVNEILSMRKEAVKSSPLFGNRSNYQPSSNVFRIQDGLPWISAHEVSCNGTDNNPNIGVGESRESHAILNPELMYYVAVPAYEFGKKKLGCSKGDYTLVYKANYTPKDNTIHAYIDYSTVESKTPKNYSMIAYLSDANARDLGYNYGFVESSKNIYFKVNKFNTDAIKTRGYYHRGYVCGLESGCNNYSPHETGYVLYLEDLPATLNIKLWHDKPTSTSEKADLNYQMIFDRGNQ